MKPFGLILFLMIMLLTEMMKPPFSRAVNFDQRELAERFEIYNKAILGSK